MSDPKANQEPSMEEILASIRRIISEDDEPESANKTAAPQPAAEPPAKAEKEEPEEVSAEIVDMAPPAADPDPDDEPLDLTQLAPMDDDVLELTQMADDTETAEPPTGLEAGSADDGSDMADTDKTPDVAEDDDEFNLGADEQSDSDADDSDDSLVSDQAVGAAGAAIARLQQTAEERAAANRPSAVALGNGSLTLEDIVREELRPLLRDWLEQNLPPLVERIVEREVEKIGRNASR